MSIHIYATLDFSQLHFVLPFVLASLRLMHLMVLHYIPGPVNPLGVSGNLWQIYICIEIKYKIMVRLPLTCYKKR